MGECHIPIDGGSIDTCGFKNELMAKGEPHGLSRADNLTALIKAEYGSPVFIDMRDPDKSLYEIEWRALGTCSVNKWVTDCSISDD